MPQQSALGFLESQVTYVERDAYQIQYPDIQYPRLVPVETNAPDWVRSITHYSMDMVGQAELFSPLANDIPLADVTRDKHTVGVEMAAIGYSYNLEELMQAMMIPDVNLSADKAMAARRAAEEYLDNLCLRGNSNLNWDGLINQASSSVTASDADNGASGNPEWSSKTPDEIVKDVARIVSGIWEGSQTVEMANTLALPPELYTDLVSRRLTDSNGMTVMEFIQKANPYTGLTGQPLMITYIRGLENAASSNDGRAIAYRRDPTVLKFHLPMPHMFLPPITSNRILYMVPGIFRTGGLEIRRPGAIRYLDKVTE